MHARESPHGHSHQIATPSSRRSCSSRQHVCQAGPIQPRRDSAIKIGFDPGKRAASAQITVCYELLRSLLPLNWPDAGLSWPGGGETPEYRAGPPCRRAPCWKARTHRGTARATSPRPTPMPVSMSWMHRCRALARQRSAAASHCGAGPSDRSSAGRWASPPPTWACATPCEREAFHRRTRSDAPARYRSFARRARACRAAKHRLRPRGGSRGPGARSAGRPSSQAS